MEQSEIRDAIRSFLETEFPSPGFELTDTTPLLEEWFLDSMGIVETVLFLEKRFGIAVARGDINGTHFASVEALTALVRSRLPG